MSSGQVAMIAAPPNMDSEIDKLVSNMVEYESKMCTLIRSYIVQIEMNRKLIETSAMELLDDLKKENKSNRNVELHSLMHQLNGTNDIIDANQILDSIIDNIRNTIDNNLNEDDDLMRLEQLYTNELEMQSNNIIECIDRLGLIRDQSTDAIRDFIDRLDTLTIDANNQYRHSLVKSFHSYRLNEANKLIDSIDQIYANAADEDRYRWRLGALAVDEHSKMIDSLQLEVDRRQLSTTSNDIDTIDEKIKQIRTEIDRLQCERSTLKRIVSEEMKLIDTNQLDNNRSRTEMVLERCRLDAKRRRLEQKRIELYNQIEFRLKYCNK